MAQVKSASGGWNRWDQCQGASRQSMLLFLLSKCAGGSAVRLDYSASSHAQLIDRGDKVRRNEKSDEPQNKGTRKFK